MLQQNPLAIAIISLSLSPIVFTNISYATITTTPNGNGGMTITYDNETRGQIVIPSSAPGAGTGQVNELIFKNTTLDWQTPQSSTSSTPNFHAALSFGGINGGQGGVLGTDHYGNLTLTIDKDSAILLNKTGVTPDINTVGVYTRTDTANATNTVNLSGKIEIISNDTSHDSHGIFAENLVNSYGGADTATAAGSGTVQINLTDGANISITNGNNMTGIYADGRNVNIDIDADSRIDLKNSITSNIMRGIYATANPGGSSKVDIIHNGSITIDAALSTGTKVGIEAIGNVTKVSHGGTITITGHNSTAISSNALKNTVNSTGNIDVQGNNATGIAVQSSGANGNITITLDANDDGNGNLTDKHISASSSGTGSAIGISAVSSGLNNNAEINIVRADYISTSGDTSTAIQGLASAGASVNINVGAINTISSNATGSNQATAINSSVVGGGNSSIMLSDDVKLIEVTGLGQAIKAITNTGTNTITLGNTKIIGGDTGGIYMESTSGIQELTSYADISAGNDRALWGTSSATTTIDNYNTITGYSDFSGTGAVTFNNNGNFVLQNFAGTNTKSTITNNFGTNGSFNNKGTISFSDKNFNGTTTDAVFNVNTFTNTGVINLTGKNPFSRNNFVGDTFTINGNYVSNGGSIYLNTLLDDATSNGGQGTSDLIVVNGSVTTGSGGATKLYITPTASSLYLGQVTVGDGIKVVQVNNSTSSDAFVLGRPLTSGIYEYTLHQGRANNNWYLSSFGLNPAVGAYLANQTAAVQMFQQSVFDRLISSSDGINNDASKNLFWMKTKMTHSSYDSIHDNLSNRSRTYTMQMGGDLNVWTLNNGGYFHLGVMGGYGDFKNTSRSEATGSKADGKVKGYTAGIYGTYFANQDTNLGLYVDMWSQMGWYRNEISGKAQIQTKKYNSTVWSNSIEFGYGLHLADSGEYQWLATPQLQLTYNHYDTDNLHDKNNLRVTNNNASGLDTRVGIRFHARGIKESLVEPFLEVNWLDTTAKNKLNFNGKAFKDGFSKDRFEAKVGLQGNINKQWSLSAQVGGQWGNNSFDSYQGQLNVNYKF